MTDKQPNPKAKRKYRKSKKVGWNPDLMFSQHFASPVRLVTYDGIRDVSIKRTHKYSMIVVDQSGKEEMLSKLNIIFAFPKEKMPAVKEHIKIRTSVKTQKLAPIHPRSERYSVPKKVLQRAVAEKLPVTIVTRTGHVLKGWIQYFDKYVLYSRIGKKMVIVYRHGLLDFSIDT